MTYVDPSIPRFSMVPFFREASHKKSPCNMFFLNIIFDHCFLTSLENCSSVMPFSASTCSTLKRWGSHRETSFEGLLITDDNDDDDNDDDQEVEENRIRPSQQLERVEYTQLLPPNLEVERKIHKVWYQREVGQKNGTKV